MKIGISRPTDGLDTTREMLETAAEFGFAGVQLKENQYRDAGLSAEGFRDAYGAAADLVRGGLIAYPGGDIDAWEAHLLPIFNFAARVQAGHVCICAGVPRAGDLGALQNHAAETLRRLGGFAREKSLRISLHNHADSPFETPEDVLRMAELLDPALCGLTLDTAHFAKGGCRDIAGMIPGLQAHLLNIHLKDLLPDGRFCPVGQGTLAMDAILEQVARIGFREWLIIDEESMHVPMREAFEISRDFLAQRGIAGL